MTDDERKAWEELVVVSNEVLHPKRLGVATYRFGSREQFLAILAADAELKALRARVNELEAERDRWYGAAIERMVRLNKLIESAEESIRRVEPKDIRLAAFRELRATITEVK